MGGNQESADHCSLLVIWEILERTSPGYATGHDFKVGNKVLDDFPL